MNIGGDPDDYGLPPVDIEIPDDARELDREVHAYYRELRAQRRRTLARRLHLPLARGGLLLSVFACGLALALLAGTLLTVFSASQRPFGPTTNPGTQPGASADTGRVGEPLPNANVLVGGLETPLRSLAGAVLAVVPPRCGCRHALGRVTRQAENVGAQVYVVGIDGEQVAGLTRQVGLRASHTVEDPENVLAAYYHPAGLTAILVRADGTVAAVVPVQGHASRLAQDLRALPSGTGTQGLGTPVRSTLASAATAPWAPQRW